jgi:hypothetical protein
MQPEENDQELGLLPRRLERHGDVHQPAPEPRDVGLTQRVAEDEIRLLALRRLVAVVDEPVMKERRQRLPP